MNQYEGMFLFDPTFGSSVENCESEVRRLMERAEAELLFCRKWDERRLAYRIKGRKRGVYMLVYFRSLPDKITGLERDVTLNENILRLLVVRSDGVSHEMMEEACAARGEERPPAAPAKRTPVATPAAPVATPAAAEEAKPVESEANVDVREEGTGAPVADAPVADAATADLPAAEGTAGDFSATDAPATDVPGADVPGADSPAPDAPAEDTLALDDPALSKPESSVME